MWIRLSPYLQLPIYKLVLEKAEDPEIKLPFPPAGDLPDPGIKPGSPALQADSLPTELPGPGDVCNPGVTQHVCWHRWPRTLPAVGTQKAAREPRVVSFRVHLGKSPQQELPGGRPMDCSQGRGGVCRRRGLEAGKWVPQGPMEAQEG